MRKLLIAMVAVMALVAFAAPSFAAEAPGPSVVVGGRIWTDFGWNFRDKKLGVNASGKDVTSFFVNLNGNSYLNAKWTSADKTTGGLIEIREGSAVDDNESLSLAYAYGWWKVGACKLVAGQTDSWLGSLAFAPRQYLGITQSAKTLMINWGFFYSGRYPQVRFEMFLSKMFGFSIGLVQPDADFVPTSTSSGPFIPSANADRYYNLPGLELAMMFRTQNLLIMPAFGISQTNYEFADNTYSGYDDNYVAWVVQVPVKFSIGGFTVKAQGYYGNNNDTTWGQELAGTTTLGLAPMAVPVWKPDGKVENTLSYGGSIEASYSFGDLGIHLGYGVVYTENDAWKDFGYSEDDHTRYAYFLSIPYQVTKNFDLAPEFVYYDFGKNITNGEDLNNEWLLGLTFRFIF